MKALKKDLLELLRHDTAVQQCIQDIIKQSHSEYIETPQDAAGNALAERCKQLEQQLIEKDAMIDELKTVLKKFKTLFQQEEQKNQTLHDDLTQSLQQTRQFERQLQQENQTVQQLEQQVQQLQAQLKPLQPLEPLQPLWEAYTRYQRLSPDTLQSLQGIFPQNTLSVFISAGLQQKNLEAFYDYIKNAIVEGDNPDQDALTKLFHTLLEYFLQAHPRYEIEQPEQCTFDPTQHIKTPDSPPSGSIKHVRLAGWKIKNNQKIIKQAIVQL